MASSRHFGEASAGTRASGGFSEFAAPASNDDLVLTDKAASLTGDALQRGRERIDILTRIVKREGGAHAALKAKAAKDRLRAMMSGAHRDPLAIKRASDILASAALDRE